MVKQKPVDELKAPPGWVLEDAGSRLSRSFDFVSHIDAANFVRSIALESDLRDHHPEVLLTWRACRVVSWTHDTGALTERDIELAAAINELWEQGAGHVLRQRRRAKSRLTGR